MAKLAPAEVTLVDVAEIAGDPGHRTALTPMGGRPGRPQRYVGRSVMWKGNAAAMPTEVVNGLSNAQKIAEKCENVKGLAVHPVKGTVIPNRALCMYEKGSKGAAKKARKKKAAAAA